ncbi:hypothetical protein L6Q96_05815 [Candidatus Binatia bacterium]|nr:hypothetical protein [Candidatus Binatia bacterium]
MRLRVLVAGVGAVVLGSVGLRFLPADDAHARRPPAVVRQFVGGGQWQSRRDGHGRRDWQVELKRRDDGSIGGRVTVLGSPLLDEARIEGRIDGAEVYGVLVGPDDRQIGTFAGTRVRKSLSGTYTFGNGDTGTWAWRGEPPE